MAGSSVIGYSKPQIPQGRIRITPDSALEMLHRLSACNSFFLKKNETFTNAGLTQQNQIVRFFQTSN
jgi:hypothetical protein